MDLEKLSRGREEDWGGATTTNASSRGALSLFPSSTVCSLSDEHKLLKQSLRLRLFLAFRQPLLEVVAPVRSRRNHPPGTGISALSCRCDGGRPEDDGCTLYSAQSCTELVDHEGTSLLLTSSGVDAASAFLLIDCIQESRMSVLSGRSGLWTSRKVRSLQAELSVACSEAGEACPA